MKAPSRSASIKAAVTYASRWMQYQMERYRQVGCAIAISDGAKLIHEEAFGFADLRKKEVMTPRHRFRVASHSKSFTAAGIMKLREQGKIGLDDKVGRYVGLNEAIAEARISELLSHSAGVARDGVDASYWADKKPFLTREELLSELTAKPPMEAGLQLKYSNHGYGLLGLVIEKISGQSYPLIRMIAPLGWRRL
jgi:D-alanyl-D-alanine carboxypeptidase